MLLLAARVGTAKSSRSSKIKLTDVTGVKVLDLRLASGGGVLVDKIIASADGFLVGASGLFMCLCFEREPTGLR